jgi:hypothetical protein
MSNENIFLTETILKSCFTIAVQCTKSVFVMKGRRSIWCRVKVLGTKHAGPKKKTKKRKKKIKFLNFLKKVSHGTQPTERIEY